MENLDLSDRNVLQEIREIALNKSNEEYIDSLWKLAYKQLAIAVDHLDAMIARTTLIDSSQSS